MSGKCFLCKYCDRSEEVCSLRGPIKDMFYGYCTRFESAAVTKHLSAKKIQSTVPAKEPEGTCTEQEQKEEEKDVVPDISSYNKYCIGIQTSQSLVHGSFSTHCLNSSKIVRYPKRKSRAVHCMERNTRGLYSRRP